MHKLCQLNVNIMSILLKKSYQYSNIMSVLFQWILASSCLDTIYYLNFVDLHPKYHKIVIATCKNWEEDLYYMRGKIKEKNLTTPVQIYVGDIVRSLYKNKFITKSIFLQLKSCILLVS